MLKIIFICLLLTLNTYARERTPVLVELFTSEGCSSCPPADKLLAEIAKTQPLQNVDLIVLSEHVDYWNSLGWKDPFSAALFSERQESYARMLESQDVYTPEVVVDGHATAVGSQRSAVLKAAGEAGEKAKPALQVRASLQAGSVLVDVMGAGKGELWVAIAQNKAVSRVAHGENGGRTLEHVAVVRELVRVNGAQARLALDEKWGVDLSVVAFVQDGRSGRILQVGRAGVV